MIDKDILKIISIDFSNPQNTEYVKKELNRIGEVLMKRDGSFSTRLQAAIIKSSDGNMLKFDSYIELAIVDWRDLLMNAGFGLSLDRHNEWIKEKLKLVE